VLLTTFLIFVTVSLGIVAGYQLLAGLLFPDGARVRRRLAQEFDPTEQSPSASALFPTLPQLSLDAPELAAAVPEAGRRRVGATAYVKSLLEQARLPLTPGQLGAIAGGLGFSAGLGALGLGGPLLVLPVAVAAAAAPLVFVYLRVRARRERLLRQLPGAFELMSRVLRAGSSVPQALQAVGDAFEDPLAGEFAFCQKQLDLGLRPEETYQEMAQRCGVIEVRIFVMAMAIQRQTGGNLSEVLERLAALVRARLRLRQQVRTLTAEGRMQGWVLIVLPVFVFGIMLLVNRSYAEVLLEHSSLLGATAGAMLLGTLWIRRIVNFDL